MRSTCAKCGAGLEQPSTGRPPTYCGTACRRSAEYELRRLQRQLDAAEQAVASARWNVQFGRAMPSESRKRMRYAEERLAELEQRLRNTAR